MGPDRVEDLPKKRSVLPEAARSRGARHEESDLFRARAGGHDDLERVAQGDSLREALLPGREPPAQLEGAGIGRRIGPRLDSKRANRGAEATSGPETHPGHVEHTLPQRRTRGGTVVAGTRGITGC